MDEKNISQRIKKQRIARALTLQDLADRTGLTKGYLSKVERSQKAPPYSTLTNIAAALDIEITALLTGDIAAPVDVTRYVSRGASRPVFRETDQVAGYDYELLAQGKPGKNMEPFIIHAPFDVTRTYAHEGEESIFVMDGTLEFFYGDEILVLEAGDNIYFDSVVPHVGRSKGKHKARLLVVIYFYKRHRH